MFYCNDNCFGELLTGFDCLKDDFWYVDCECNDFLLDLFLLKYLPFVNNVVDFSFPIFYFNVNFFVSCLPLLFVDLDLVCLLELRQNHAMKKEGHERNNEISHCSIKFKLTIKVCSRVFCHSSRNSFTNFNSINVK